MPPARILGRFDHGFGPRPLHALVKGRGRFPPLVHRAERALDPCVGHVATRATQDTGVEPGAKQHAFERGNVRGVVGADVGLDVHFPRLIDFGRRQEPRDLVPPLAVPGLGPPLPPDLQGRVDVDPNPPNALHVRGADVLHLTVQTHEGQGCAVRTHGDVGHGLWRHHRLPAGRIYDGLAIRAVHWQGGFPDPRLPLARAQVDARDRVAPAGAHQPHHELVVHVLHARVAPILFEQGVERGGQFSIHPIRAGEHREDGLAFGQSGMRDHEVAQQLVDDGHTAPRLLTVVQPLGGIVVAPGDRMPDVPLLAQEHADVVLDLPVPNDEHFGLRVALGTEPFDDRAIDSGLGHGRRGAHGHGVAQRMGRARNRGTYRAILPPAPHADRHPARLRPS